MRLFIAEKPSLAKAIFEGLGGSLTAKMQNGCFTIGDDKVTSCFGHMLELFEPQDYDEKYKIWRLENLPIRSIFPPSLKPKQEAKQRLEVIFKLIDEASEIVNAGDNDDEGVLLINELLTYVNNNKPVKRILISDLNLKPVQKALENLKPNENYENMGNAALARSIGDQLFGYNLTRAYTLQGRKQGFDGVLNVGRVQSAVLGLVNSRTLINQEHQESFYYDVIAKLNFVGGEFSAKYQPTAKDNVDEKNRIIEESNALEIKSNCNKDFVIIEAKTKAEKKAAPLPYNLSSLQQACAKKWGYSADITLEIIQTLYETHKLLTYPRSDCRYLSDEHLSSKDEILKALKLTLPHLSKVIDNADLSIKHKAFNADKITAHHAICPTEKNGSTITLTESQKNVYGLVVSSFIALFYTESIRDKTKIVIDNNNHQFVATKSILVSQGWESIFKNDVDITQEDTALDLSKLKIKDCLDCKSIDIEKKKTSPPKYFVESTLLGAMTKAAKFIEDPKLRKVLELKDKDNSAESGSIGTEATRASILNNLANNFNLISIEKVKGYQESVWKTTQQGQDFCAALPKDIIAPDTSAIWSERQALIRDGKMKVEEFLKLLDVYLAERISEVKDKGFKITSNMVSCHKCKTGFIGRRKSVNSLFWACNNRPECKTSYPDKNGKPDLEATPKRSQIISKHKCPECEKGLIRRKTKKKVKGKVKFFWGCSGYPECEVIMFEKGGKPNFESAIKSESKTGKN
jgi:DNA topoisomerase-3